MKCKRLLLVILSIAMTSSMACGKRVSEKVVSKYNIEAKALSEPVEKISAANKINFRITWRSESISSDIYFCYSII